jgi:outer membrane protein TolC
MKTVSLWLVLLQAGAAQPSPVSPLTLVEALATALRTSPRLEAARGGTASARAEVRAAGAEGRPKLELGVSGQLQGPEVSLAAPGIGGGDFRSDRSLEPQATLTIPLYTGGRVEASKRAAKRGEKAALLREQAEAQRLVLDVTTAYLEALEARERLELARLLRSLNQDRLRIAQVRQKAGAAIPLEVSQAESDLAISVQQEIEVEARTGQAGAQLNSLLGRPVREPLVLERVTPASPLTAAAPGEAPRALSPEDLLALGMERPDLKALREDVRRAEAQVDVARAQRRPLVNFSANYLRRLPETLLGGFAWSLGASLVQTLFDGGRSRAKVEAARADLRRTQAGLTQEEREAQRQVEQTRLGLEAAERRVGAEERRLAAAREAVTVAETRARAGEAPRSEVTEARTTLTRAEVALLTARFDAARARVQLAYVTGAAEPEKVVAPQR